MTEGDALLELSARFRKGLVKYVAKVDPEYGWPLYGFKPREIMSKACTEWESFIGTFVVCWNERFKTDPHPMVVKKARTYWKRYSMTGYEAFVTITQKASDNYFKDPA